MPSTRTARKPVSPPVELPALPPRRLNTREACLLLGVSEPTLRAYRQQPGFPKPYRLSDGPTSPLTWDEAELRAWLEKRRRGGPNDAA